MHGLGNDFVIINSLTQTKDMQKSIIANLANRYTGIGFDQLLIIEPSQAADFFCRIYNADGSEAQQCGNGLRCVARYLHEEGMHANRQVSIETLAGIFPIVIHDYEHIRVCMGTPNIKENDLIELQLTNPINSIPVSILSLGNPHAITKVDTIDSITLENMAMQISTHSIFPEGVNVGFMQIIDKNHIQLRTFERGAGETLACGSNACAAVVAGITQGWLQQEVKVKFTYGSLTIAWEGDNQPVYMTGPATRVYSGDISI
jgi:diaminopimelate epimerase